MKRYSLKLRHIGLLAVFFFLASSLQAQSKLDALFNKLGENKKMTVVTISKDMMGLLATQAQGRVVYLDDTMKLANQIGSLRVITSKELSLKELTNYDKMIMEFLNDGYKDLMNISSGEGGNYTKYRIDKDNDMVYINSDTVDLSKSFKPTIARMCIKPIAKDTNSMFEKISEFIIYVREKNELSLIAIVGNIYTFDILTLTKLANLKGMLNQTMKLQGL